MSSPLPRNADLPTLISVWQSAHDDFLALIAQLSDDQWSAPTDLPGWTVADVVAHVTWLEAISMGEFDPPHEPDWDALPHVVSDSQRKVEVGVDRRRSWSREQVMAEATDVLGRRGEILRTGPQADDTPAGAPFGPPLLAQWVLQRSMDTWVHEQDIRRAVHVPGNLDSLAAQASATQLSPALPMIWGKRAGAQPGQSVRVEVTEPGVTFTAVVAVNDEGRAGFVSVDDSEPTVSVVMPWEVFAMAICGRGATLAHREAMQISGDEEMAERFTTQLSVTP